MAAGELSWREKKTLCASMAGLVKLGKTSRSDDFSNCFLVDRADHTFLGDDAGDQLGRGNVKRRVVDFDAGGSSLAAEAVGHLVRIALLDRDGRAVGDAEIKRARRSRDVERDA